jgi:hypothetical protein
MQQTNGSICNISFERTNDGIELSTQDLTTGLYLLTLTFENGEIGTRQVAVLRE